MIEPYKNVLCQIRLIMGSISVDTVIINEYIYKKLQMKTLISLFMFLPMVMNISLAQGEVIYTTKVDMHANLPDDESGEMIRKYMPQYQTMKNTLLFNEKESVFGTGKSEEKEPDLSKTEEDGIQVKIRIDNPQEITYSNLENNTTVEQKELMDKTFLISDSIRPTLWKITTEMKEVSGYNCQKAELLNDKDEVFVWFTTQIPVPTGPKGMGGLPGLIVYASLDSGNYTIAATKIILREVGEDEIQAPKKGKQITQAKYEKLVEKKRKQQEKEYGSKGGVMITTEEM